MSATLTVADAKPGDIIEMIYNNQPSGRYYRVGKPCAIIGKVACYERFTKLKVKVHPTNHCRIVTDIDGF